MAEQPAGAPAAPTDATDGEFTFTLNGRPARGRTGEMLIAAAERAGVFIPRFCYHPRMKSVGVCRMCLVEVTGPRGATLQPSCYLEVTEGMEVVTDSPKVKKAQDGVLEFLLVNHPLDCPVCDKGGECPLQDQTLAYGPGESRFVEEKRHFEKPIPISDLVLLDRERCIQCSRCTRFAAEVAGEAQIDFSGRGEMIEVSTFPDQPFSSYFSGNTVQICPVGALTAVPYRFTARPWDLDQVESTCTTCAMGCRVAVQSSANRLTRILGIDSEPVNHGWLCDKGRFAFESVNAEDRITQPMVRRDGELVPTTWNEALDQAAAGLRRAMADGGPEAIGVLGGARLTNEGAYLWARLAKGVIGTDSVDAQLGDGLPAATVLGLPRATIAEAASAATVVLLCGDLREELPVAFLRLRTAAVDGTTALIELAPQRSALTPLTTAFLQYRPGDVVELARALIGTGGPPQGVDAGALEAARQHVGSGDVVVVLGRPSLAEDGAMVAEAAEALAGLPGVRFLSALRRGNVHGALDMGLAPGVLPGRVGLEEGGAWFEGAWGSVPARRGRDCTGILSSAAGAGDDESRVTALVLLGSEPSVDVPDRELARRGLGGASFVVAVTSSPGEAADRADVVLPAAEAHERPGTTTNIEGRVSRVAQKLVPPGQAWPDWMIASELARHMGSDLELDSMAAVWAEIERLAPAYAGITADILDAPWARDGVVAPFVGAPVSQAAAPLDPIAVPGVESVERQGAPPRAGSAVTPTAGPDGQITGGQGTGGQGTGGQGGGRPPVLAGPAGIDAPHVAPTDSYSFRLVVGRTLYDGGTAVAMSEALTPLVASAPLRVNPHDLDDLGISTGDLVRVRTARDSVVVPVAADPGLARKVVATELNVPFGEVTAGDLIDATSPVVELRLETP